MLHGVLIVLMGLAPHAFADTPISKDIEIAVKESVNDALAQTGDPATYSLQLGRISSNLSLGACEQPLQVEFDESRIHQSQISTKVTCAAPKWSVRVPVKIMQFKQVVVATKHLNRGENLTAENIGLKTYNVKLIHQGYYESLAEVQNKVLSRSIPEGTVLTAHMIKMPILIRRGDAVKIVYEVPGLKIESTGISQSDGAKDEMIKVKNARSNILVDAQVKDKGVAIIPM